MKFLIIAFAISFVGSVGLCQDASKWQICGPPTFDFANIVVAKAIDESTVSILMPDCKSETRSRMVPVTKFRQEARIKTAEVDGKSVEQEYTVQVPYTETLEQSYQVRVIDRATRKDLPISELVAWDLQGNKLSSQQVQQQLKTAAHVYFLSNDTPPEISAYHAAALNPRLLFVFHPAAQSDPKQEPAPQ